MPRAMFCAGKTTRVSSTYVDTLQLNQAPTSYGWKLCVSYLLDLLDGIAMTFLLLMDSHLKCSGIFRNEHNTLSLPFAIDETNSLCTTAKARIEKKRPTERLLSPRKRTLHLHHLLTTKAKKLSSEPVDACGKLVEFHSPLGS